MNYPGPSSVTLEEAVAKMVGVEYVPENMTLLNALEVLSQLAQDDYFRAQEKGMGQDMINQFADEMKKWNRKHSRAMNLLDDLERSVEAGDPHLTIFMSDTIRKRLSTQGVYTWAKKHHDIEIEEWKEFRASSQDYPAEFDNNELHGRQLLLAIAWLTDELLSEEWPAWKGNIPSLDIPENPDYFQGTPLRPNVSAISKKIAFPLAELAGDSDIGATIRKHIDLALDELKSIDNTKKRYFSKNQLPGAYKTLYGLYQTVSTELKLPSLGTGSQQEERKMAFIRFLGKLSRPGGIRRHEMVERLEEAFNRASPKKP